MVADTLKTQTQQIRGIQFDATADSLLQLQKSAPLFAGFSVSGDIVGAIMAAASSRGQYEGAFRLNLKGKYFPVFEAGFSTCDHTDETTNIHFKTNAPFFRIGCDYNFARDIHGGGRILGGLRYGFSAFDYDTDAPDIIDPVWGDRIPFAYKGLSGSTHWTELVFGLEAKIWKIFRLGWNIRYRIRLKDKTSIIGRPWHIPGYGKNDTHALSGTFNFVFDI